jgi:hypothetical protein
MTEDTITLDDLFNLADTLTAYANQLMRVHYCAMQGEISPGLAAEQANAILSRIENIAQENQ